MELRDTVIQFAQEYLKDDSYFLVDVIVKGVSGKTKILILLDGDNGVNIDDCASLSRQVSSRMEAEEVVDIAYIIEVSSPGLDHPITLERQYEKNVGRALKLTTKTGDIFQGELLSISDSMLEINKEVKKNKKVDFEPTKIPLSEIEKANVLVSFK